jgi:hypothetical protein
MNNGKDLSIDFSLGRCGDPCRCPQCLGDIINEAERHEQAVGRWKALRRVLARYDQWEMTKNYRLR